MVRFGYRMEELRLGMRDVLWIKKLRQSFITTWSLISVLNYEDHLIFYVQPSLTFRIYASGNKKLRWFDSMPQFLWWKVVPLRPCLHDSGSPSYRSRFHIGWGYAYTAVRESDTLFSNNPVQHWYASAGGIKMNPYRFVSCVNIVIWNETLPNLVLIIGWLQCKWGWSIAWQTGKENNKDGRRNEINLARNSVTGLFSRLRVNTHTPERFLYRSGKRSGRHE